MKNRLINKLRVARYAFLIFTIIIGIALVNELLKNATIRQNVDVTNQEADLFDQEAAFYENFYIRYLSSDYVTIYDMHSKHLALPDEIVIDIENISQNSGTQKQIRAQQLVIEELYGPQSPQESWNNFFEDIQNRFIYEVQR